MEEEHLVPKNAISLKNYNQFQLGLSCLLTWCANLFLCTVLVQLLGKSTIACTINQAGGAKMESREFDYDALGERALNTSWILGNRNAPPKRVSFFI